MTFNTVFSIVLMVFYIVAFVVTLLMYQEDVISCSCNAPLLFWLGNVTLFWTVITVSRLFFGYNGGSPLATQWSRVIYLQAVISIIGVYIVRKRNAIT